jgi:hypothetical protein
MMSDAWAPSPRLQELAQTVCRDELTAGEGAELETLLYDDRACRWYRDFCLLHTELWFITKAAKADAAAQEQLRRRAEAGDEVTAAESSSSMPMKSRDGSAVSPGWFPISDSYAATGYLTSGWPAAYLIATVILGLGLLIGAVTHVSPPEQIVQHARSLAPSLPQSPAVVGQVTGMVDCRFATGSKSEDLRPIEVRTANEPRPTNGRPEMRPSALIGGSILQANINKTAVSLSDKFNLVSGLLEITYNTGGRVILQGPVRYEVDSVAGGYLRIGKLTAKVNKGLGIRDKSPDIPHPSSLIPHPLFIVRTPTAAVTDLGTEFGVEVDEKGTTTSYVLRGSVRVQIAGGDGGGKGDAQIVGENEAVRVERPGDGQTGRSRIIPLASPPPRSYFVREIPKHAVKTLDLVDVVAGGDGFSGRRNRGIDPTTGRIATTEEIPNPSFGDGRYHRVEGMPLIDGVCVPHSDGGPVQLDSAGHSFAWFPATDNRTCCCFWAGKAGNNSAELGGVDYALPGHGCLAMDANKVITFDMEAIRRANPGLKPIRFRAVAGNAEQDSDKGAPVWADVWVFVDGQVRFRRREITRYNGAMSVAIAINDYDRFLTLASTDGGNGYQQDHIVFGDPRLELAPATTPVSVGPAQQKLDSR